MSAPPKTSALTASIADKNVCPTKKARTRGPRQPTRILLPQRSTPLSMAEWLPHHGKTPSKRHLRFRKKLTKLGIEPHVRILLGHGADERFSAAARETGSGPIFRRCVL